MATSDSEIRNLSETTTLATGDKFVIQNGTNDAEYITADNLKVELEEGGNFQLNVTDLVDADGDVALRAVDGTGTIVNRVEAVNSATSNDVTLRAAGSDTNISLELDGKGTGAVKLRSPVAPIQTLSDAATISWDITSANTTAVVTLGGNRTLGAPSNSKNGMTLELVVRQDGTGGRTLAYHSSYKFPGGTAPTVASGANEISLLRFFVLTSSEILCMDYLNFS